MAGLTLGLAFGLASGLIGFTDGLTAGLMGLAFWLMRLVQGGAIDLVRHLLSCNDQPSIKIAE
jgi:hypothetical protein